MDRHGITRRRLLEGAAGAALAGAAPASAFGRRPRPNGRRVAILGGGVAGLTAAHELSERGFQVTVYERKALGGKARSIPVTKRGEGGRKPLPGEHGFRFFPGFYRHVPDTMRRIPSDGNPGGVRDNLVTVPSIVNSRAGRPDVALPAFDAHRGPFTVDYLRELLTGLLGGFGDVPPHELGYFVQRLMVFLTSCDERRYGQWEHVDWMRFVGGATRSAEYRTALVRALTSTVVAAKEDVASTRTIGNMAEAFVLNMTGVSYDGSLDRVLDAPTNEAWIDPWIVQLRERGVRFRVGHAVEALRVRGGRIASARVLDVRRRRRRAVEADWFVCAVPSERAKRLMSPAIRRLDPRLEGMDDLFQDWMSGVLFYLRRRVELPAGHLAFIDSPWAITGLTQAQFWDQRDFARDYGDGTAVDCLSCDVSDWDTPGILYGKPAKRCTRAEVIAETWAQVKAHVNDGGAVLRDDDVVTAFVDPAIRWDAKRRVNSTDDPLLVNTKGSWDKRPTARTEIPNLFIAGDHVQTNIDLATMEGANEAARDAANALLDAAGSNAPRARKFKLHQPPELRALKAVDRDRYRRGRPNLLDLG